MCHMYHTQTNCAISRIHSLVKFVSANMNPSSASSQLSPNHNLRCALQSISVFFTAAAAVVTGTVIGSLFCSSVLRGELFLKKLGFRLICPEQLEYAVLPRCA